MATLRIDVSDEPELLRLIERAREAGEPIVLSLAGDDLAVLSAVGQGTSSEAEEARPYTKLWALAGSIETEGPTDVSENKRKYLADSYEGKRH